MPASLSNRRLHLLERMNLRSLRGLDRDRTIVFLPVGMLEEHGSHLPFGTDTFAVDALTLSAAAWLLESDPGLHIVIMPTIPYGTDPVDTRRQELFEDAGSVWIRPETLKAIVQEVTGHMIRFGFTRIFPIGFHGGPGQSIVLAQACAEMVVDNPALVMIEPVGYVMAGAELEAAPGLATLLGRPLTTTEEVALNSSVHASMFETSLMLYLDPELVDPDFRHLRTIDWRQMYQMADWPGYVGAGPSHANAEVGGAALRWRGVRVARLIDRALQGEDITLLPRHPNWPSDSAEDGPYVFPVVGEPYVDSHPEIVIPPGEAAEARARMRRGGEESPDETPHSHLMETRRIERHPPAKEDEQDG
ncbi:MAG: creatininase family protein [Anaerolineae bacterium]|nr:creatininase family protein [Anaerolineae bacterium]